jgi:hypothetical protein
MFVLLTDNKLYNQNIRYLAPRRKNNKKARPPDNLGKYLEDDVIMMNGKK